MDSYGIRRLVLDVLKPHNPNIVFLADHLCTQEEITGVNITVVEVDAETESVKITIDGSKLDFEKIRMELEDHGAAIHSIDQVVATKDSFERIELVEEALAPIKNNQ
ncbi:MAG: DUF211 domain-containing protein [Candidatus Heimdallarchaeota archaeon]